MKAFIALIITIGCGQALFSQDVRVVSDTLNYTYKNQYTIQYPGTWRTERPGSEGVSFVCYPGKKVSGYYKENLQIKRYAMPKNITSLSDLVAAKNLYMADQELANYEVLRSKKAKGKNYKGREVEFTFYQTINRNRVKVRAIKHFVKIGDNVYELTFMGEPYSFSQRVTEAREIMKSFRPLKESDLTATN